MASLNHTQILIPVENADQNRPQELDCSRSQKWLRAAMLGANDGLVSVASLIMGIGASGDEEGKVMIVTFFAGLFASACSTAMGEFASMWDVEAAQMKREKRMDEADLASALSFSLAALAPLLAASFITEYSIGLVVAVVAATTVALAAFGGFVVVLGKSWAAWSCARMVVGGWMAMGITFGVSKLLSASGMEM